MNRATLPSTPETIKAAITDLLQSDGWLLLEQEVRALHGPEAVERDMKAALMEAPAGNDAAQRDTVSQVIAKHDGARAVLDIPQLLLHKASGAPTRQEPQGFDRFRRIKPERARW